MIGVTGVHRTLPISPLFYYRHKETSQPVLKVPRLKGRYVTNKGTKQLVVCIHTSDSTL